MMRRTRRLLPALLIGFLALVPICLAAEEALTSDAVAVFLQALEDLKPQAASIPAQIPQETARELEEPFGDPFSLRLQILAGKPGVPEYLAKKGMNKDRFLSLAHRVWQTWLAVRLSQDKDYVQGLKDLESAWQSPKTTSEEKLAYRNRWEELRVLGQFKLKDKLAIDPYMEALNKLFGP